MSAGEWMAASPAAVLGGFTEPTIDPAGSSRVLQWPRALLPKKIRAGASEQSAQVPRELRLPGTTVFSATTSAGSALRLATSFDARTQAPKASMLALGMMSRFMMSAGVNSPRRPSRGRDPLLQNPIGVTFRFWATARRRVGADKESLGGGSVGQRTRPDVPISFRNAPSWSKLPANSRPAP
jgi:hypothetical protein